MSMDLKVELMDGYLSATVLGSFSLETANKVAERLFEIIRENEARKILVDCSPLGGAISMMEQFFHAKHFSKELQKSYAFGVPRVVKFAYVLTGGFADPYKIAETFAVNRHVNVRTFDTARDAIGWLTND